MRKRAWEDDGRGAKRDASAVIDLTCQEGGRGRLGAFVGGAVRLTQSDGGGLDPDQLSFEEILQADSDLEECILTSYVADQQWVLGQLAKVPRIVLCLGDGDERLGRAAYEEWPRRSGSLTVIRPPFPHFPTYGVMHCKLMLLFYPQFLRLAICSGNLVPFDYDQVQNVPIAFLRLGRRLPRGGLSTLSFCLPPLINVPIR